MIRAIFDKSILYNNFFQENSRSAECHSYRIYCLRQPSTVPNVVVPTVNRAFWRVKTLNTKKLSLSIFVQTQNFHYQFYIQKNFTVNFMQTFFPNTGSDHVNFLPPLTAFHTIWMRQHNHLADELKVIIFGDHSREN